MNCSVIICTHNRANILKQTLHSILQQKYNREKLELIVVDNCSTDHTRQVIESLIGNNRYPLRYVYELKLGLSHARNCGILYARGDVVIFIDDDSLPQSDVWIQNIVNSYLNPEVCAAGGDIDLIWPNGGRPGWVHDFLLPSLGKTMFDCTEKTELHFPLYPWGSNISFRKDSVEKLNGFSTQLGRTGMGLLSGEETELCLRLEKAGKKIVYVPDAVVLHTISPERLSKAWFKQIAFAQGLSDAYINSLHATKFRIQFELVRKTANVFVHLGGKIFFFVLRNSRMGMFCTYNLIFSWAYVLRVLKLR